MRNLTAPVTENPAILSIDLVSMALTFQKIRRGATPETEPELDRITVPASALPAQLRDWLEIRIQNKVEGH